MTTTTDDLIAWLQEQIDEDELQADRLVEYYITEPSPSPNRDFIEPAVRRFASKEAVLAECAAKRQIIALCQQKLIDVSPIGKPNTEFIPGASAPWGESVLRQYGAMYAALGRPGYRAEWRPDEAVVKAFERYWLNETRRADHA